MARELDGLLQSQVRFEALDQHNSKSPSRSRLVNPANLLDSLGQLRCMAHHTAKRLGITPFQAD